MDDTVAVSAVSECLRFDTMENSRLLNHSTVVRAVSECLRHDTMDLTSIKTFLSPSLSSLSCTQSISSQLTLTLPQPTWSA